MLAACCRINKYVSVVCLRKKKNRDDWKGRKTMISEQKKDDDCEMKTSFGIKIYANDENIVERQQNNTCFDHKFYQCAIRSFYYGRWCISTNTAVKITNRFVSYVCHK
ncbi:hypothetical protein AB6A40_004886 [Gnathostoma spinigerum]|uniref:Uncharacterized protein n=1 Tax=Gnathostoma spinigerum TaxID=75299 RepID=A0ABD6EG16_9BILA